MIDAIAVDVADTAGNLRDGVHVASAGGAWMAAVYGFAGYRWRTRGPEFAAVLGFVHPVSEQQLLFESLLPCDFARALAALRAL